MFLGLWIAGILTGLLMMWALGYLITNRAVIFKQLIVAGVVEAIQIGICIIAAIGQLRGATAADGVTLWGYLLTCLILLPIAAAWALADRTRISSAALAVVTFTLVICQWRVWQVWSA
ncbi:MAG: hypothetical protein Q4B12_08395 [Bowdeniella nasicola]|nr:hypothetical protein [Bowdeniella nasicola]